MNSSSEELLNEDKLADTVISDDGKFETRKTVKDTSGDGKLEGGEEVTWTISVRNVSDVEMTNILIQDDLENQIGDDFNIDPAEEIKITTSDGSQADITPDLATINDLKNGITVNMLKPDTTVTLTFTTIAIDEVAPGTDAINTAKVTDQGGDIHYPTADIKTAKPRVLNYKIDATTLDFSFLVDNSSGDNVKVRFEFYNEGGTQGVDTPLLTSSDIALDPVQTEQEISIDNDGTLQPNTTYDIYLMEDTIKAGYIQVHTPSQIKYNRNIYAQIGDTTNQNTYVEGLEEDTDQATPDTESNYGIYELESIGYEDANGLDAFDGKVEENEWDKSSDLTITKYNHVVRPIVGYYEVNNNIEASEIITNTQEDVVGGFGEDGYRPIGQVIGTKDGEDSIDFTGVLTGNVDQIEDQDKDNTVVSNLYINEPSLDNIGMIAREKDARISDLGMVDPNIIGQNNVGSIVGYQDSSEVVNEITNVYALQTTIDESDSIVYEVSGAKNVGGLVGLGEDLNITSDGRMTGEIEGIDLSSDGQPSNEPDKDGYKTFSTIDVKGTGSNVGGIEGQTEGIIDVSEIDKAYAKGSVTSEGSNVGGILGKGINVVISNTYNGSLNDTPTVIGNRDIGGIAGYLTATEVGLDVTQILNSYNYADVESTEDEAAGIVGSPNNTSISNVYNTGNITADCKTFNDKEVSSVGGISGNSSDLTSISINNAFNTGTITGDAQYIGGIAGDTISQEFVDTNGVTSEVSNSLNMGDIVQSEIGDKYTGSIVGESTDPVTNSYNYTEAQITGTTDNNARNIWYEEATSGDLNNTSWWIDTLGFDSNWNINAGDSAVPNPDADKNDESADNNQGTISNGYYPTVKEADSQMEVPEQEIADGLPIAKIDLTKDIITPEDEVVKNGDQVEYSLTIGELYEGASDMKFVDALDSQYLTYNEEKGITAEIIHLDGSSKTIDSVDVTDNSSAQNGIDVEIQHQFIKGDQVELDFYADVAGMPNAPQTIDNYAKGSVDGSATTEDGATLVTEGTFGNNTEIKSDEFVAFNKEKDASGDGKVQAGEEVTWTVLVRNITEQEIEKLQISDNLEAQLGGVFNINPTEKIKIRTSNGSELQVSPENPTIGDLEKGITINKLEPKTTLKVTFTTKAKDKEWKEAENIAKIASPDNNIHKTSANVISAYR